ncbi:MAG: amidohydrolase family protein [Variovorax sp.]
MQPPRLAAPPGACDTHMHVYEERFGLRPGATFVPPHAPAADYAAMQRALGLSRVVVVQANGYGDDNRGMREALHAFGDAARGVAIVRPDIDDGELQALHAAGVRGVRFHMLPGGVLQWPELDPVVERVAPLGWHVQLQMNGNELPRHEARLRALPLDLVIDHVGKFLDPQPPRPQDEAFRSLLRLMDGGRCWVKLSAPYESSKSGPPGYADVAALARELSLRHPGRCLWGSNWPHPTHDPRPSDASMLDLLLDWVDDPAVRTRILVDNPAALYGFAPT